MDALLLVLGSVVSHPWAREVVTNTQKIVTYFRATDEAWSELKKANKALDIQGGMPQSCNKTHLSSVLECCCSVLRNQPAFRQVLHSKPESIRQQAVKDLLPDSNRSFWPNLQLLCDLLQPFNQVVKGVQSAKPTIADMTRYWLHTAGSLKTVLPSLPLEFQQHVVLSFCKHAETLVSQLSRLALFLDPRYKKTACFNNSYAALFIQVRQFRHVSALQTQSWCLMQGLHCRP